MRYHIVGIGGVGMSAHANLLLDQGHRVSGSQRGGNRLTAALEARGATVHINHDASYVNGADVLLHASSVAADHPEIVSAHKQGIPVIRRWDLWHAWSQARPIIAVAGTHGKTTTTGMIALALTRAGLNPGFLIGGESRNFEVHARWGDPNAPLIIEADEYERAFLSLKPSIGVITNVDWDHPDVYHSAGEYRTAFKQFAQTCEHALIVCGDSQAGTDYLCSDLQLVRKMTYGLEADNDYQATNTTLATLSPHFQATFNVKKNSRDLEEAYCLSIPGVHNIRNALAAIAVADVLNVDAKTVNTALAEFQGTVRRFQIKGEGGGVTVVDDIAHHPTEVSALLASARLQFGSRRIVAFLQPHTYSRTETLLQQWPAALADADVVLVGDIYAGGETNDHPDLVITLTQAIAAVHEQASYVGDIHQATATILTLLRVGDVLITMGAGDGDRVGEGILEHILRTGTLHVVD